MSVLLTVDFEPAPIERADADLVIVCFCQDDRPLRGSAGRADWRLCGQLSQLLAAGRVRGESGEALLIGPCRGLAAPLLLALGLGPRRPFGSADCQAHARDAVLRALGLGASRVVLPLPDAELADLGLKRRVEAVLMGAVQALSQRGAPLQLRLLGAPEEAPHVAELLSSVRPRPLPPSVELQLPPPTRRAGGDVPAAGARVPVK